MRCSLAVMVYFFFVAAALGLLALLPRRANVGESRVVPKAQQPGHEDEFDDMSEFAGEDQLEALVKYGVPEDAARLAGQGIDLGALGYRPDER